MEVHKHPHHVMHKKNWGEYFLEFFMIFMAVFLGFLAENWRENIVDHRREKELMRALVNDLKLDTSQLSQLVKERTLRLNLYDSTIQFYSKQNSRQVPLKAYRLSFRFFGLNNFYQNTGTLDQLKNSGGFRLISHNEIIDTIEKYDMQIRRMSKRDAAEGELTNRQRELVEKLFDSKSLSNYYLLDNLHFREIENSTTINLNPQYIDEYVNLLITFRWIWRVDTEVEVDLKNIATRLIEMIKKDYHLHE